MEESLISRTFLESKTVEQHGLRLIDANGVRKIPPIEQQSAARDALRMRDALENVTA